jgi:putative SOS response-associated peptidase YedK
MLERYTLSTTSTEIVSELGVDATDAFNPIYNGAPTHLLPVITHEHPGGFSFFYWGLPPEMTKNKPISGKLINADSVQLSERTSYRNALLKRRCLIPANGFFLWKKVSRKGKVPYRFIFNNEMVFLMCGIWEEFDSDVSSDTHTFSLITIPADNRVKKFSDTMPAIIKDQYLEAWMDKSTQPDRLLDIINDTHGEDFGSYPVSSQVNNININTPELIQPSKPMDQFGNYSLFD